MNDIEIISYSLNEIHEMYLEKKILINEEYYKTVLLYSKLSSRIIESFLLDLDINPVYCEQTTENNYHITTSHEIIGSCIDFFNNEFCLKNTVVFKELENKYFKDLDNKTQFRLKRKFLKLYIIRNTMCPVLKAKINFLNMFLIK